MNSSVSIQADFAPATFCDQLVEIANMLPATNNDPIQFWNGRYWWYKDILATYPAVGLAMRTMNKIVGHRLARYYQLDKPVYPDLLQIVQWPTGMSMPAHADNAHSDGKPHDQHHRDYSSIIYLNDDYTGGELQFVNLGVTVKPTKGMLVTFPSDMQHKHAVLKVESGIRFTLPSFFTFDLSHADRELL